MTQVTNGGGSASANEPNRPTQPSEPTSSWRVAIIEDHALVVAGLQDLIAANPSTELSCTSDDVASLMTRATEVDLAIVDLGLPRGWVTVDDLEPALAQGIKIIVVTGFASPKVVRDLYLAGVTDVVSKADPPEMLTQAIGRVLVGDESMSMGVAAAMANFTEHEALLSNREQQVLALYGSGLKIATVARQIEVTENTVKEYLKRIRIKLAEAGRPAPTQRDIYREAVREGLLDE